MATISVSFSLFFFLRKKMHKQLNKYKINSNCSGDDLDIDVAVAVDQVVGVHLLDSLVHVA